MRRCWMIAVVGLALATCTMPAGAQDRKQDEQAIRATAKAYLEAIARGDAKAAAAFWVPGGDIVDSSRSSRPASEILTERVKPPAAGPRPTVKIAASSIRFLTADSAIEDGTSEITPPGSGQTVKGHFSAVWIREQDKWKLASLREVGPAPAPASSPAGHLSALDPFAGNWAGRVGNRTIDVSAAWDASHAFLVREMRVIDGDKTVMTANQRIGWDPAAGQIKSWAFDSFGGHGEATWHPQEGGWLVNSTGTLPDGKRTTSTNMYSFDGPDTLVWKSQGSRQGATAHNIEIKLTRQGPAPVAATSTSTAATPPATAASAASDGAKKAEILKSARWRRAIFEMEEWLSTQKVYTPEQVAAIKRDFSARVAKMSAAELEFVLNDMDAKFKVLETPQAQETRAWLAQYLSILSDKRREEVIRQLPNPATATAAQLSQELAKIDVKRNERDRQLAQSTPRPTVATNPWDPGAATTAAAYAREQTATAPGGYYSPYSSAPKERPFADVNPSKQDFGMYVGAYGGFGLIW